MRVNTAARQPRVSKAVQISLLLKELGILNFHFAGFQRALEIKQPLQASVSDMDAVNTAFRERLTMHIEACKQGV